MRRASLLIIAIGLLILAKPGYAFADAVYLKNGTVMTGRIVEKTPDYIVLKTSEDEDAVRVTVFLEDVYKVEEQEVFVGKLKFVPYGLLRGSQTFSPVVGPGRLKPATDVDEAQAIKELLLKNRQYQIEHPADRPQELKRLIDVDETTQEELLKERKQQLASAEASQQKHKIVQKVKPAIKVGDGSISGYVILPDLSYEKRKRGDLYVYLMEDIGEGKFIFGTDMLFTKIDYRDIIRRKVVYKIAHVPAGRYKIFAQWDVQIPFIEEKIVDEDKKTLGYLGAKGDYSGSYIDVIQLAPDEKKQDLDFNCFDLIQEDQFSFDLSKESPVVVEDLYYRKLPSSPGKIILLVKNTTQGYINLAVFDIFINDKKILPLPFQISGIEPLGEKELDITSLYSQYKAMQQAQEGGVGESGKTLRFKFVSPATGEVVFDKAVLIL